MKVLRASAVAAIASAGCTSAFGFGPPRIPATTSCARTAGCEHSASCSSSSVHPTCASCSHLRRDASLRMQEGSSQATPDECEPIETSRRDALRRCSSIVAAAFATTMTMDRRRANAAEFASSLDEAAEEREWLREINPPPIQPSAPMFNDGTVITPVRPQAPPSTESTPSASIASNAPPAAQRQITLENSQVVQVPVASPTPSAKAASATPSNASNTSKGSSSKPELGPSFLPEAGAAAAFLGASIVAVTGRPEPNTDELTAKCKVVMIQPEPYGLQTGRNWYGGVNVRVNDPVPASDVKKYCDAGTVNNDCTEQIAGFLGDVSKGHDGTGPSAEQHETATAVLTYLNSLTGTPYTSANDGGGETAEAFSSYLNGLAAGEINAPDSPRVVAEYLDSLNGESFQRLSAIEGKVNALEASVDSLPGAISGRLQQWQESQDERLAREFYKIEEYLMNKGNGDVPNGGGPNGAGGATTVSGEGHQFQMPLS